MIGILRFAQKDKREDQNDKQGAQKDNRTSCMALLRMKKISFRATPQHNFEPYNNPRLFSPVTASSTDSANTLTAVSTCSAETISGGSKRITRGLFNV